MTAYEMRISDWSSDVCSSDLDAHHLELVQHRIDAEQARVAHQLPHRHHHLAEELDKGDQHLERLHCGAAHVGEDAGKRRARVGPYLRGLVAFPHLCDQAAHVVGRARQPHPAVAVAGAPVEVGRAHVRTPGTYSYRVRRLLLETPNYTIHP